MCFGQHTSICGGMAELASSTDSLGGILMTPSFKSISCRNTPPIKSLTCRGEQLRFRTMRMSELNRATNEATARGMQGRWLLPQAASVEYLSLQMWRPLVPLLTLQRHLHHPT